MHAPVYAPLSERQLLHARRAIREMVPQASASHVAEALARALGFRTHAALLADLQDPAPRWRPLDESAFRARLTELTGGAVGAGLDGYLFDWIDWPDESGVIETDSKGFHTVEYGTKRALAWRNMMVLAVNEGLDRGLLTMAPDGNFWSATAAEVARLHRSARAHVHEFVVDGHIPAMAAFHDGGFGELRTHVALWPTKRAREFLGSNAPAFLSGQAEADGWLERRDGAYLQVPSKPSLSCRQNVLDRIAALKVEPRCFADRGSFRM